jgi:hypothetical protein
MNENTKRKKERKKERKKRKHCKGFIFLAPLFYRKIFKIIPPHPETEVMYVRYLLVYRLWKKIHSNLAVKKQINANAISSLRSLPTNLPVILLEQVLPSATLAQGKLSDPQSTKFYLCQHFDLRKACSQFLQYCRSNRDDEGTSPADDIIQRDQRVCIRIHVHLCIHEYTFLYAHRPFIFLNNFLSLASCTPTRL